MRFYYLKSRLYFIFLICIYLIFGISSNKKNCDYIMLCHQNLCTLYCTVGALYNDIPRDTERPSLYRIGGLG